MKVVRFMMLLIQFLMPGFWISHLAGYKDWKTKRTVNELLPILKIIIATILLIGIPNETIRLIVGVIMIIDTLYFLSILVVFNDLKKPSVSEARTMITIMLNAIELVISFALFADLNL